MPQQNTPLVQPPAPSQPQTSPFEIITPQNPKRISSKGIVAVIAAVLFLVLSIGVGAFLVQRKTNVVENAAPASAIYVIPASQNQAPGTNFSFSVNMDTATNAVTALDIRLIFDPAVMQVLSLEQGSGLSGFTAFTNTYDNTAGTVSYAAFNVNTSNAISGSGVEVLKINAVINSEVANGSYNITFDPATAASATQEGQNVIISKTQGTLVIAQSSVTPSPTAIATATPTNNPNATPSPVPTATAPGATPAPTATATSAPQATATAQPTTTVTTNTVTTTVQSTPRPLPESGTDWPTMVGIGLGLLTIIGAFVIAI